MKSVQVINLAEIRQLLAEWDKVRAAILAGHLSGFHAGVRTTLGVDTVFLGGVFKSDPAAAMRGILRASAAARVTPADDKRPLFQASMM